MGKVGAGLISSSGRSLGEGHDKDFYTLARRIPWTEAPSRLQFKRLQGVVHDWRDLARMHDESILYHKMEQKLIKRYVHHNSQAFLFCYVF